MRETNNEGISNFLQVQMAKRTLSQICENSSIILFKDILAIDFGDVRILHSTYCISSRSFQILVVRGGEIEKVRRSVTLVVILLWIGQL